MGLPAEVLQPRPQLDLVHSVPEPAVPTEPRKPDLHVVQPQSKIPEGWCVLRNDEPPLKVEPYVEGSYVMKLPSRENEWVVTQDGASLPGSGTYGKDKPMAMRAWHAPGAKEEARRIMEKGRRADVPLAHDREVTMEEAEETPAMFMQMYGRRGKKYGGDTGIVACASQGLPFDRVNAIEDVARNMAREVAGDPNAPIVWFGPHKFLVVVRGSQTPEEMIERYTNAPEKAYKQDPNIKHLWKAIEGLTEKRRREDILGPYGTGRRFVRYFNKEDTTLERAFIEDDNPTFAWPYHQRGKGRLVAKNPDKDEQEMMDLAINARKEDVDMQNKIYTANTTIGEEQDENMYVIEVNFHIDAVCCGFSSNAKKLDPIKDLVNSVSGEEYNKSVLEITDDGSVQLFRWVTDGENNKLELCSQCNQPRNSCPHANAEVGSDGD